MSYHSTGRKIEAALRTHLLSETAGVSAALIAIGGADAGQNIYTGVANGMKDAPCVVVAALSGQQDLELSGNFWFQVGVAVRVNGTRSGLEVTGEEETLAAMSALTGAVHDAIMSDGIVDTLNAQGVVEFAAIGVKDFSVQEQVVEDCFESEIRFSLYCAPCSL